MAGIFPLPIVSEQPRRALPSSLSSLVLDCGRWTPPFNAWLQHLNAASSLQHLQLVAPTVQGFQQVVVNMDWSSLQLGNLRELYISLPSSGDGSRLQAVGLPDSMSALSSLEVLMGSTYSPVWPWPRCMLYANFALSKLRQMGRLIGFTVGGFGAAAAVPPPFPQLTSFEAYLSSNKHLPSNWESMSHLQHLSLEMCRVDDSRVQQLQRLTQLTSLRLSTGCALVNSLMQGPGAVPVPPLAKLEPLGRALVKLHRLELVNCCKPLEGQGAAALIVPDGLSSFTPVKELQLAYLCSPSHQAPPSAAQPAAVTPGGISSYSAAAVGAEWL